MVARDDVVEALHGVEDPELGMDIVELGLMYDVEVDGPNVKVLYSLTSMGCPAGAMIAEGIVDAARSVPGVSEVEAELTSTRPGRPTGCPRTRSSSSASAEFSADRNLRVQIPVANVKDARSAGRGLEGRQLARRGARRLVPSSTTEW